MGYQGIKTKTERIATKRAPPKLALEPGDAGDDDGEFPDAYESGAEANFAIEAKPIDQGLERLIELAAGAMGCSHDEVLDLKARALIDPMPIANYCQEVFDLRVRADRERANPLEAPLAEGMIRFWLEGFHGRAIAEAPLRPEIAAYHKADIELRDPARSPFKKMRALALAAADAVLPVTCPPARLSPVAMQGSDPASAAGEPAALRAAEQARGDAQNEQSISDFELALERLALLDQEWEAQG